MTKCFYAVILSTISFFGFTEVAKPAATQAKNNYDPTLYRGIPVMDANNKLKFVDEHPSQTQGRDKFVMIRVRGIKTRGAKEKGRVRIALWDNPSNYAKEGVTPFRANSHFAKDSVNGEMLFKVSGLEINKQYAFFAHFDKEDRGYVRKVLGIPTDPFIFSNTKNQGKGPGLTREGLSPPKFENTLVKFLAPGQEILLEL